ATSWKLLLEHYMDPKAANRVAARIVDWIDRDSVVTNDGMETAEYIASGLQYLPRNGLLRSLDEVLNIPGITPALFNGSDQENIRGLRDLIILNATGGGFNPATAPKEVLRAYGNLNENEVAALIRARERQNWEQVGQLFGSTQLGEGVQLKTGLEFVLRFRTPSGLKARAAVRTTYS